MTLVAFEALAVATVLPVVSRDLGGLALYGWVFSAFALASLVGIAVTGALADRRPLTGPMLAGTALFAAGLLVGGLAPDMALLVVGRAVQGLGAGVVPAVAYVAIARGYPDATKPRMFAVLSTAWVVPGLVGPAIGALVASALGWRWVFLGLLPLVTTTGALAAKALRSVPGPSRSGTGPPSRVPVLNVLGVVVGAGTVLASLSSGTVLAAPGLVLGAGLLGFSLRRVTPAGTLRARPGLPATVLSRGLLTLGFFAGDAYVPYAVTTARHGSTFLAGAALTASTLTWAAGAWAQARTVGNRGPRLLVRTGEVLVLAGLATMAAVLLPGVPVPLAVAAWALGGLGIGLAYAPLSLTTLQLAPAGQEGRATSALQLTDTLGQALGTGAAGAAVAAAHQGMGPRGGVALAFATGAVVMVAAALVGRRLPVSLADHRAVETYS